MFHGQENPATFVRVATIEDEQPIRAAGIHPGGELFAVGSNSMILQICAMPDLTSDIR